jgi:hypothetical protein
MVAKVIQKDGVNFQSKKLIKVKKNSIAVVKK